MNNRPDFFEPNPKMPEWLIPTVYSLKAVFYEDGRQIDELELFTDDEIIEIRNEISNLFSDHRFVISYCSTFYVRFEDDEIPKEWLKKTLSFGISDKELRLVGDRIPITVTGHPTLKVRFMD